MIEYNWIEPGATIEYQVAMKDQSKLLQLIPQNGEAGVNGYFKSEPRPTEDLRFMATASEGGKIIGALSGSYCPILLNAEIYTMAVHTEWQGQKIGWNLLRIAMKMLKEEGCRTLFCMYSEKLSDKEKVEHLLKKTKHAEISKINEQLFFDVKAFEAPWLTSIRPFPTEADVVMFPWKDLTVEDRQNIEFRYRRGSFPVVVDPFISMYPIEHINSLGLRSKKEDRVIGWIVTSRVRKDTICYKSFWIEPEYATTGYAASLLIKSIHLQKKSDIRWGFFVFGVKQHNDRWRRFIDKRFKNNNYSIIDFYICNISLMRM